MKNVTELRAKRSGVLSGCITGRTATNPKEKEDLMSAAVLEAPTTSDEPGGFTLEVYSKPSCVQCGATHRKAKKLKIAYVDARLYEDVELNQEAVREFGASLGITAAPLLVIRNGDGTIAEAWGGFNPGKMDEWAPVLPTLEEAARAA